MESAIIGKIEKAKRYAEERERFHFTKFELTFHGDNNEHRVTFDNGTFTCDCEFFIVHSRCAHTMTLQDYLLKDMLPTPATAE